MSQTSIIKALYLFDIAAIVSMVILAYLSRRLGEALKTPPYYRLFYGAAGCIFAACAAEIAVSDVNVAAIHVYTMAVRLCAGCVALCVSLRYWKWLFAEFLSK